MAKMATVKHGPSTWFEKSGPITREEGDYVWVVLQDRDDGKDGLRDYEVMMPRDCVVVDDGPAMLEAMPG